MNTARTGARMAAGLGVLAGLAWGTAARGQSQWTGAVNNIWLTPGNWNPAGVPGSTTDAVVPAGFPEISGGIDVRSVSALSPLRLSGAICAHVRQPSSIRDGTIFGGVIADGPLTFTGAVTSHTAYSWIGSGGYRNTGTFTVIGCPVTTTFTNDGTMMVPGTFAVSGAAATLVNNGTLELGATGNIYSGGLVVNNSTWRKAGAGTSEVQGRVTQAAGLLNVEAGNLKLGGGGLYQGGTMLVESGAQLVFEGPSAGLPHTFAGMGSLLGGGDAVVSMFPGGAAGMRFESDQVVDLHGDDGFFLRIGTIKVLGGVTLRSTGRMTWNDGVMQGPGVLVNEGTMSIPPSEGATAVQGAIISNQDFIDCRGAFTLSDTARLVNEASGIMFLDGYIQGTATQGVLVNLGQLGTGTSPVTTSIGPRFEQRGGGITRAIGEALSITGGGEWGAGGGRFEAGGEAPLHPSTLQFDSGTYAAVAGDHTIRVMNHIAFAMIQGSATVVDVRTPASLSLEGYSPLGWVILRMGAQLGGTGTIVNRGPFEWASQIGVNGQANFCNAAGGNVEIPATGARLRGTFINKAGGTVEQQSGLNMALSTVENQGPWVVHPVQSSMAISGAGGVFRNFAEVLVESPQGAGIGVTISTTLDNPGQLAVLGGVTVNVTGQVVQLVGGHLTGGQWVASDGGRLLLPTPITAITGGRVYGSRTAMPWLAGIGELRSAEIDANGDIQFNGPLAVHEGGGIKAESATLTIPGELTIGSGTPGPSALSYAEEYTVVSFQPQPPMIITPTLRVHEGIRPGGPDGAGPFNLTGNLVMMPTGVIEVDLGGLLPEEEHDRVTITGGATLAGTLDARLLPGFVPQAGQQFTVLTATGAMSGVLAVNQPPGMPAGLRLEAVYGAGTVTLRVVGGCYANCDGSTGTPTLNVNDFVCFQSRFAAGDPYANCDASTSVPVLNVGDFVCFLSRFAAGCP